MKKHYTEQDGQGREGKREGESMNKSIVDTQADKGRGDRMSKTMTKQDFERWMGLQEVMGFKPRTEADQKRIDDIRSALYVPGTTVEIELA